MKHKAKKLFLTMVLLKMNLACSYIFSQTNQFKIYSEKILGTETTIKMIPIKSGTFNMGSSKKEKERKRKFMKRKIRRERIRSFILGIGIGYAIGGK